ncbi:MAG: response regulator transcription factor [Lachnospiraceae bacterium]|nr:response regulator transcription factor [Lachnospiraceae bacterium]
MSLKVCFCDDNIEIAKTLKTKFEKIMEKEGVKGCLVDIYDNAQDMIVENTFLQYDAVFMDIEMPGIDGYQAVKLFRTRFPNQEIIFVSSHDSMVFYTGDVKPLAFVRKSKLDIDLPRAVKSLLVSLERRNESIEMVSKEGFLFCVPLRNIIYFDANGHNICVHFIEDKETTKKIKGTLGKLEDFFSDKGFIRVHKSYLVNYRYIAEVGRTEIMLEKTLEKIPMSKHRTEDVKIRFADFCRRFGI